MARKSLDELAAQADAALPDNTNGAISPADIRTMIKDFLDTISPSYGGLRTLSKAQQLTATPVTLLFESSIASFPPEWTVDPAAGTLRRIFTLPAMISRFTINGDIIGPQGGEVTVGLYANNVFTGWVSSVTAQGTANRGTFSFCAVDLATESVVYTLKVSANSSANYTFENVLFVGENIPVRSFTTRDFNIR